MKDPTYTRILLDALRKPRYRWTSLSLGFLYLLLYLYAVGQLPLGRNAVSPEGNPAFVLDPGWPTKLFEPIAGYTFEPVAALYPFEGLTLFIAPLNLLIGVVLGGLIALNVASAAYSLAAVRTCRRLSWTGLLGSLPALLTGFACRVPTVGLFWNLHRTRREFLRGLPHPL